MKKKQYEKPSLEVVVMKQQSTLLAGSGEEVQATMNHTWEEENI